MKLVATRRVDHAIRILKFLVSVQEHLASARIIATATGISPDTVRQLMQTLGRAQLVASLSGPNGGYRLTCIPIETNMQTVVEACEGPIDSMFCDLNGIPCGRVKECALHILWSASQKMLAFELSAVSLADVMAAASG